MISEKSLILQERQSSVRQAVETAHGVLSYYQNLAATGAMPETEAKRRAVDAVKSLRYSGDEYFWINDMEPRMVMHPFKPELDGKDLAANKDPSGKHLFVEFVNTVKAGGSGFVFYMWPKPGSQDPVEKVSYVKGFAPWGWLIGSGIYIDTVNAAIWQRLINFSLLALAIIGVLLAICVVVARSITRPLNEAVGVAQRVAAGDLTSTVEVKTKDETGLLLQALKDMNESLKKIVSEVRSGSEAIGSGTREIASGNADLSQRTEEQASSLEETASSMEELTSTVKQNAENARQANQLALGASTVAVKGGAVVSEVVQTMSSINESSKKIVDIIGVIDGIAFQTNILALNAAVEAARAGEQGRGFAVVASEVRNLAQRSAAAAKEIKQLIGDSVDKVGAGTRLVDEAGKTMEEIVSSVKRVTDIMSEITAASQEQSAGIEQVNQAITQMDEVTQQNAALVEEAAAAAESLQEQAQNLETAVAVFKLSGAGPGAEPARRADAPGNREQPLQPPVERRGPDRAQNVARLRRKPSAARIAPPKAKVALAGGEDKWEEF
jgi:methyl-accepting chemotaxis protein